MFLKERDRLIRKFDNETIWIEPWGDNSLRVRATLLPEMPDNKWALLDRQEKEKITGRLLNHCNYRKFFVYYA